MSDYLPPDLLEKMKAFDSGAPEVIMTRAKEIQNEQIRKELTELNEKIASQKGLRGFFRPAALKAFFQGLANPFGSAQNYYHQTKFSSPDRTRERVRSYLQQAFNEYIEQNDFPRDKLDTSERAWLDGSSGKPSANNAPQARI